MHKKEHHEEKKKHHMKKKKEHKSMKHSKEDLMAAHKHMKMHGG